MQRHRILLVTAAFACAPLGCQTVSDVFNEPPRDQQTERAEDEDDSEARRAERAGDRDVERRERTRAEPTERREEAREAAKERAQEEAARERRAERRETREDARERAEDRAERVAERRQTALARDYIAASSCPVQIEGARVSMIDIVDGIALDFRAASAEDTEALRERVRRLMDTQREVRSAGDVDDPDLEALPPVRVEYDIQRQGARIEFKVDNQADLRDLRTQLRERVSVLRDEGECPRDFMTMLSPGRDRAG